jgi:hypothetical protein
LWILVGSIEFTSAAAATAADATTGFAQAR